MNAVTEEYEQQLWEELNSLLADVVPEDAGEDEAVRVIMLAMMGHDREITALHKTITRLAREGRHEGAQGYLRQKLEEDNPVTQARRRLYGKWA